MDRWTDGQMDEKAATICSPFGEHKNKKNIISLLSAEFAHNVVSVKVMLSQSVNLLTPFLDRYSPKAVNQGPVVQN